MRVDANEGAPSMDMNFEMEDGLFFYFNRDELTKLLYALMD